MTLPDWERNGWLKLHVSSPQEVRELLEIADRDIADAARGGMSLDWQFGIAYNGVSSFRLLGAATAKSLQQAVVKGGGLAGEGFVLSGWSKARGTLPTGGTYGLEAKVAYTDGTFGRFKVGFTKGAHGWEYKQKSFTPAKPFKRIVIYLRYAAQAGRVWFDDIQLVRQ